MYTNIFLLKTCISKQRNKILFLVLLLCNICNRLIQSILYTQLSYQSTTGQLPVTLRCQNPAAARQTFQCHIVQFYINC